MVCAHISRVAFTDVVVVIAAKLLVVRQTRHPDSCFDIPAAGTVPPAITAALKAEDWEGAVPEMTVAIQSFLKIGFLSAVQLELSFMTGGVHAVTKAVRFQSFRNFVPKDELVC
jgi:hypothetical protein